MEKQENGDIFELILISDEEEEMEQEVIEVEDDSGEEIEDSEEEIEEESEEEIEEESEEEMEEEDESEAESSTPDTLFRCSYCEYRDIDKNGVMKHALLQHDGKQELFTLPPTRSPSP